MNERYPAQALLPEIGPAGQEAISCARDLSVRRMEIRRRHDCTTCSRDPAGRVRVWPPDHV